MLPRLSDHFKNRYLVLSDPAQILLVLRGITQSVLYRALITRLLSTDRHIPRGYYCVASLESMTRILNP